MESHPILSQDLIEMLEQDKVRLGEHGTTLEPGKLRSP